MEGGTVFHFVDASPQEALDVAREAAGKGCRPCPRGVTHFGG
jgi:hypothetical protein